MKRKIWALLLGLAMLPTVVLPVAAETSTPTVTNLYTLDFENADTSKAVAATDKELFATWLPSGFDASLMTVANGGDSWQYAVVSEAPSNSGNALKFISTAKPSSGNKYLEMKTPTAKDDYSDISTGANGAAILSFDYYANGRGQFIKAGRVLGEEDGVINEINLQEFIRIDNAGEDGRGAIKMFGDKANIVGYVPLNDSKWHKFNLIATSDNKYSIIVDGDTIVDFTEITYYTAPFRGWSNLRFYNNAALNSGNVERYMDNISYDVMKNVDFSAPAFSLSHSDKYIEKYFSLNGSADPVIYAKPETKIADFVGGLKVNEFNVNSGTATVLDADGNDISKTDKTLVDAAKLKVKSGVLGIVKEYPVVTTTSTESTVEAMNNGTVITETGDDNDKLVVVNSRVEAVGGISGKAADDYALKLIPTTTTKDETTGEETVSDTLNSNGYLDYNIQKGSVVSEKANMPMTFEFSAYTEGAEGVADIEMKAKAGDIARIRLELGTGKVLDAAKNERVAAYKVGKWNRFAISVYPNSMTYVVYVNGEKAYTKEITEDSASRFMQRIRLRAKYMGESDMILFDDVKLTYGAYEYTQAPPTFADLGDKFELGKDAVTLYPHRGVLVSDVIKMANANGFKNAKVYTDANYFWDLKWLTEGIISYEGTI